MLRRVLVVAALTATLVVSPAGALDLESVVDCRWAIERVLHERREWPAQNPGRKPAFEALVGRADIARRVRRTFDDAARATAAGARFDGAALQAELDRMARSTRDPALLAKLFAAAGDGERAALCLALPDLVARTVADASEPGAAPAASPTPDARGVVLPAIRAKGASGIDTRQEPPEPRYGHTATWTGAEMVIFGGSNTNVRWGNGSRYLPATDSWVPITATDAPSPRFLGVAVWTGLEVIIFGGTASQTESNVVTDHARYRPANDLWGPVSTTNALSGRFHAMAVWTGTSMIVFGGANGMTVLGDGGIYTPSNNTWTLFAAPAGSQRHRGAAAWSGSEMLIFGGMGTLGGDFLATGLRYTPGSPGTFAAMSTTNAPSARAFPTAVWFDAPVSRLVVWGGQSSGASTASGALYDPGTNEWTTMATAGAPTARHLHTAVSTGTEMIVWGGAASAVASLGDGARYSPATNAWPGPVQAIGAPAPRRQHTAVWTGDSMIVWGGIHPLIPAHSGGRYTPSGNAWSATWSPRACTEIAGNLVPNCGLENGDPPTGWQAIDGVARDALLYRGAAAAGKATALLSGTYELTVQSPCFPIAEAQRYEIGMHVRLSRLTAGNCGVFMTTSTTPDCSAGGQSAGGAMVLITAAGDWTLARGVTRATPPFAVAGRLNLECSRQTAFDVHVDDAFVVLAGDDLFADGFE